MDKNREHTVRLLERAIQNSGLTPTAFARQVLLREPGTVLRWLKGGAPIPKQVVAWLETPRLPPWPKP